MEIAQERKPDCEFVEAKQMDHQRRLIDVEELARAEVLAWGSSVAGCKGLEEKTPH